MPFKSIQPPSTTRPTWQGGKASPGRRQRYILRQNLSISTWLLLGALAQSLVVFFIPRLYAILPALLVLAARLANSMAITWGWKKNPYLEGATLYRNSAQIPDEDGNFHEDAADEKVSVFMLGAKSNHPLGVFAPNLSIVGNSLNQMFEILNSGEPSETGFLGGSFWTNQDERGATEFLYLSYWRSSEDIHRFAYGDVHREIWDWWNRTIKENDHIGINHEIFEVDRKSWETVYLNFQPTLLGATTYLRKGDKTIGGTVDDAWMSPLVDARRGKLRSSAGRLGRDPQQLYEKHGLAPGASYES